MSPPTRVDPVAVRAVLVSGTVVVLFATWILGSVDRPLPPLVPVDPVVRCRAWSSDLPASDPGVWAGVTELPDAPDVVRPYDGGRYLVPAPILRGLGRLDLTRRRTHLRAVPVDEGGGLRLGAVHPASLWAALEFRKGDVLVSLDGEPVRSDAERLRSFDALAGADLWAVAIERRREGRTDVVCVAVR